MTVLFSGGGTGGHITPILSVARELKKRELAARLIYVGERNGSFRSLVEKSEAIDSSHTIFAGKFRRYHKESWIRRLTDIRTLALNVRDFFYFFFGFIQAIFLVKKCKPDVVFLKGGFVGVPVGLAAALWRVPIITHDSDAVAGLANRIVSRWTTVHATAFEPELYPYDTNKTKRTGVIVSESYKKVTSKEQERFKQQIGLPKEATLLLVTGGSSGAEPINQAMRQITDGLIQKYNSLYIVIQAGKGKAGELKGLESDRVVVHEFLDDLSCYSGAADIIVMRAGANTLAEFGVQGKACIVIPSPHLTGGHQLENAQQLAEHEAILKLEQSDIVQSPKVLAVAIDQLLSTTHLRTSLSVNIQKTATVDASSILAEELITIART